MRPDDAFWAARIVAKFDDGMVRAIVEKAKYSDPKATDYITQTLIARRDKVLKTYLNQVNPIVNAVARRVGHADVRERRRARQGRDAGRELHAAVVPLRQRAQRKEQRGRAGHGDRSAVRRCPPPASADSQYIGVTITGKHAQRVRLGAAGDVLLQARIWRMGDGGRRALDRWYERPQVAAGADERASAPAGLPLDADREHAPGEAEDVVEQRLDQSEDVVQQRRTSWLPAEPPGRPMLAGGAAAPSGKCNATLNPSIFHAILAIPSHPLPPLRHKNAEPTRHNCAIKNQHSQPIQCLC